MNLETLEQIRSENTERRKQQFLNFIGLFGLDESSGKDYIASKFTVPEKELRASRKRGRLLAEQFVRAYNKSPDGGERYQTLAWRSLFMPTELLYAMDVMPFTTEMAAAQLSMMGCQVGRMETAEENHFSQDICSFIRTAAGSVIEDIFPSPDVLVTTSHLCDPSAKFAHYAAIKYKRPEFVIDIPFGIYGGVYKEDVNRLEEAVNYVADQLKDLVSFLITHAGATFDQDRFRQTLEWANQARHWMISGSEFAHDHRTAGFKGSRDLDYAANLMQTWGTEEIVKVYKARYDELVQSAEDAPSSCNGPAIHWYHLKPYFKNNLLNYIENQVPIVRNMVNYIYWDEMDTRHPFRALARKTLLSPGYCPVSVRANITVRRIRQGEGVIAYYPKSCRHFHSSARIEAGIFKKANIPYLAIDGDCVDNRGDDFAVVQTRVDRFIKTLKKGETNAAA